MGPSKLTDPVFSPLSPFFFSFLLARAAGQTPPHAAAESSGTGDLRWFAALSETELVRDVPSRSSLLASPSACVHLADERFDGAMVVPVQDFLASVKMLAVKRAETAGHTHLADAFDLRMLQALGTARTTTRSRYYEIFVTSVIDR